MTTPEDPAAEFDAYRDNYGEMVDEALSFAGLKANFFARAKARHIRELVARHVGTGARGLDIGCGVGTYFPLLWDGVGELVGVDVSGDCIAVAREQNPAAQYDVYDGRTLPYADASFDFAYSICVVHHVPVDQWPVFASELYRVLRPGGIGMLFEHNPRNPLTMRVVSNCAFDERAVLLGGSTARELLLGAGFGQVGVRYILTIPPRGRLLRRVDRLFRRIPLGAQYCALGFKPH